MSVSLRRDQLEDLAIAIGQKKSFNLSEPGTGKTPIFCALAWYHWSHNKKKTIIVQPNHLRAKNRMEVLRFTGFKPEEVAVLEKADDTYGPRKRKQYPKACQETGYINFIKDPDLKVFCVGFTFLKNNWKELLKSHPDIDLVVVDEGHLGYKTYNSLASRSLYAVMDHCNNFYYCTGTIIDGRLDTCFAAVHIVEPRYYGSYNGFLAQHAGFVDDYGKVLYWINEEKVSKILNKHGVRRLWAEVHGEQDRNPVWIDDISMKPHMREAYDEFEAMACVELDDMMLDGSNPGVATLRARQIINCPSVFNIDERPAKLDYLEGIATEGTIVFSSMPKEVEECASTLEAMGLRVGYMHGGVGEKRRVEIDRLYNEGKLDCICSTPAVAATGWNWQRTNNIVYTSLDYLDSNLEQSIKRGERELREKPLNIYFLQYKDSVDQKVWKIVSKKENLSQSVLKPVTGL